MLKKKTYYDYLRQELGELVEQLELSDLYKRSLNQRWIDQVVWADKKAAESRRWHYRLRLTTIVGGVILPALVGINFEISKTNPLLRQWFPYLPFALSQVIAVSAAIEEFCRFGDRWRDYRQMSEDLKAEGWQYLQLSGSYENTQSHTAGYPLFASRVESIIKNDVQNYITDLIQQQAKQEQKIEKYLESAQAVAKDKTLFASPIGSNRPPASPYGERVMSPDRDYPPNGAMGTATLMAPIATGTGGTVATLVSNVATTTSAPTVGLIGWLRTQQNTVFKLSPQPSEALDESQKISVYADAAFGLQAYREGGNQHLYVTLNQGLGAEQRNSWYVYAPHIQILNQMGQPIQPSTIAPTATPSPATLIAHNGTVQLPVPYLSQTDNTKNPDGSCNTTSIAMCLKYLGAKQNNPGRQFEDELQDWLEARGLDRHEAGALQQAVEGYGCKDNFTTNATIEQVQQWLEQGNPCVTHGYFTSSGHIVCIVGYNDKGLLIHDPWGEWTESGYDRNDSSTPEKGKAVTYTYDMIQRTCMSDGQFWVHFISKPGAQPTIAQTAQTQLTSQAAPQPNQLFSASGAVPSKLKNMMTISQPGMSFLTANQLIQIVGSYAPRDRLHQLISSINQTLEKYQITTPLRIAHFIAQVAHESDCFNAMEEYASGEDYEGREDLGNTQPGDGKRFKGRGLIQLTGRANYQDFSQVMGVDFIARPEQVAQAPYAVLTAGWYWNNRQINPVADRDDLREVTRLINGGYNGIEERERYLQAAKQVLKC